MRRSRNKPMALILDGTLTRFIDQVEKLAVEYADIDPDDERFFELQSDCIELRRLILAEETARAR